MLVYIFEDNQGDLYGCMASSWSEAEIFIEKKYDHRLNGMKKLKYINKGEVFSIG